MIGKEVTFENFDGEKITKKFWFNLNKAEVAKLNFSRGGGITEHIQRIVDSNDTGQVLELFDELLSQCYGVRGDDGFTFHKSTELWEAFKNSDAYSELFMELIQDPEGTGKFFGGILPKDYQATAMSAMAAAQPVDQRPKIKDVETNIFDVDTEPTGPVLAQEQNRASVLLANMSDEEKAALRAQLG